VKLEEPIIIDHTLIFDGFLFATGLHRCRYIGTVVRRRPQWLKDNPSVWRRVEEVLQELASLPRPTEIDSPIAPVTVGPSSPMSSPDIQNNAKDGDGADTAEIAPKDSLPPEQPSLVAEQLGAITAPSVLEDEDEITIGSRRYVSANRLASMLGISRRTLARRCAEGKAPSKINVGNKTFFELP
jgi:hypothetical protein